MRTITLLRTGGLLLLILGAAASGNLASQTAVTIPEIEIVVDPRVELMSIVFRLAGHIEYNQPGVLPYVEGIRAKFERFQDHPAITLAKELQLRFSSPMFLAICLTSPPELKERIPLDSPDILDDRFRAWVSAHGPKARVFLEEVRRFVEETDFLAFFGSQQELHGLALARAKEFVRSEVHLEWFSSYFRKNPSCQFILALAPNNGGPSYGLAFRDADGTIEYYCILGLGYPMVDESQHPVFGDDYLDTIIHEFCHSFINPLVDAHRSELKALGEKIFSLVEREMKSQGYGSWETMIYETFVRACVLRYVRSHKGPQAAKEGLEVELEQQFLLVDKIFELLGEFETQKERYPSLDSFFPKLVAALNEFAENPGLIKKTDQQLEEMHVRCRTTAH